MPFSLRPLGPEARRIPSVHLNEEQLQLVCFNRDCRPFTPAFVVRGQYSSNQVNLVSKIKRCAICRVDVLNEIQDHVLEESHIDLVRKAPYSLKIEELCQQFRQCKNPELRTLRKSKKNSYKMNSPVKHLTRSTSDQNMCLNIRPLPLLKMTSAAKTVIIYDESL